MRQHIETKLLVVTLAQEAYESNTITAVGSFASNFAFVNYP